MSAGETLRARLDRRALSLAEALDLAAQIAAGLAAAHEQGVVHGSLEPAMIWISPVERAQVIGFGFGSPASSATAYRLPEQLAGGAGGVRSDIWALGVILYEMLAGRVPFTGTSEVEVPAIRDASAPLAQLPPGVPPAVSRILERALAADPAAGYGRSEEMLADLQAAEASLEEGAEPTRHGGLAGGPRRSLPGLLTGRTVSHFRVAEYLGGGGMGVIYRAEDTRLGRTVALKVLAPELGRDPIAKARFEIEARAVSALEHPNLCTVLDVGETEEGLLFFAMPLYEGESLEERLARGPLPIAEALDIATQVARGLAKAHRRGIVHRDVKPANLFLTGDGVVKVLDFGIAKLTGQTGPTREGLLLGTPSYMAPEQMRGREVDARADVWSLGAVLYRMLAGREPFAGGTGAAVVHAVLYEEPEPLGHLRPELPPEVERIVSRMLARDPEMRPADAGEVLADLRRAQGLPSATVRRVSAGRRTLRRVGLIALGSLLVTAAGWWGLRSPGRRHPAGAPRPVSFTRLTDYPGRETYPSLSPDGASFVYVRTVGTVGHIFWQRVGGGNAIDLTADSPADNSEPAFSPDGQQIAFRSERDGGGIFLMGATGESVRRLTEFGFNPTWAPDGREIAVATEDVLDPSSKTSKSRIFRIGVARETRLVLGVPDGLQPSWSPHGWRIAYWSITQGSRRRVISTVAADGGAPILAIDDSSLNWSPAWSPDGRFLYFASDRSGSMNLWRVAIDERSGRVLGAPQPIMTPAEWSALPSFSRDGRRLLYATNDSRSVVEQVAFDPQRGQITGSPTWLFYRARQIPSCEISPDGRWIVFGTSAPQEDLFLIRPDEGALRQLTNDRARDRSPRWSPDGRQILFYSNRSGKNEAWTIRPDGSGLSQITRLPHEVYHPAWSPDGRHISFTYENLGTAIMDLASPASALRVLPPLADGQVFARASWSDDGRFLVGQLLRQDGSAVPGIVLWRLADGSYRRLTKTGDFPELFHSGRRILFTEPDAIRLVIPATGTIRTLLSPPSRSWFVRGSVGPGDRTLCTVRITDEGDIWLSSLAGSSDRG